MTVRKYLSALILMICLAPLAVRAQDIAFSIRYFDKKVYYADSREIGIKVTLTNDSPNPYRFKLADEKPFSVDFEVFTLSNRQLNHTDGFIKKRSGNQPVFFREITLEPGEEYSFVENLIDYAAVTDSGSYVVKASFYPELVSKNETLRLQSNPLSLNVRPALGNDENWKAQLDQDTMEILSRQALPPDQVVEYTISARQKSQWNKYFLYLDLESLLTRMPDQKQRYLKESEDGRRRMIDEYRQALMQDSADQDINTIPSDFQVTETFYTAENGTVKVIETFAFKNFILRKLYTYYLNKRDGIWFIADYLVKNLGTE
jgi:hypothetical protein